MNYDDEENEGGGSNVMRIILVVAVLGLAAYLIVNMSGGG
jgi:hypothetical protein